jgi:hypothetical protein
MNTIGEVRWCIPELKNDSCRDITQIMFSIIARKSVASHCKRERERDGTQLSDDSWLYIYHLHQAESYHINELAHSLMSVFILEVHFISLAFESNTLHFLFQN